MQGHDLRRLVTTFLVLALLAGSATLAVTSLARQRSEGDALIARTVQKNAESQVPKIGDTALIEEIPGGRVVEGYDLAKEFSPTITTRENYTDTLAKGLAYEFVKQNPNGPEEGYGIAPPIDIESFVDEYVTDAAMAPTTYAIDESRVKVVRNYTTTQVDEYFTTLDQTMSKINSDRGISGLMARASYGEPTEASMQASNFIFSDAQEALYNATVPEPAADMHRSLLTYLELNRQLSDINYATDPLKAVVFTAKFPELRAQEEARVRLAVTQFEEKAPEMFAQAREPFMIASMLGVSSAHAFVFTDIKHIIVSIFNGVGIAGTWTQTLVEWARKIATQILKNQIVGRMIQQTIKWVQGGGKPQFITNWKKFLTDAGVGAANQALTMIAPQLCTNFSTFASGGARAFIPETRQTPITCTLDQVVQNIRAFYDDFRAGGWAGFLSSVLPENNVFGAVILANEQIARQSQASAEAASQNAAANQGYKGMERCVSYDLEIMTEGQYQTMNQSSSSGVVGIGPRGCFSVSTITRGTTTVPSSLPPGRYCEVKVCRPGGMQQTTPGGAVAGQVEKALGASLDNIVNAEDLAGLIGVLIDAAITRLVGMAERGILGLFNGDGGGPGPSTTGTSTLPGSGDPDPDIDGLRSQALQLIGSLESRINQASSSAATWPTTASSTVPVLRSVALTCTAYASDANQRIGAIDRIAPTNEADRTELSRTGRTLATLRSNVASSTSAMGIATYMNEADVINSSMASVLTRVAIRVAQIDGLRDAAQENLRDRACNIPLPTLDE